MVSKPIKVVVVVVVIVVDVFKLDKKICCSKNNPCPKNFRPKSVGSKKIWAKKS